MALSSALAAFSLLLCVWLSRRVNCVSVLQLPLIVACALTALQILPLPEFAGRVVAPATWRLLAENARALGASPPGYFPSTQDVPATLRELAKLGGILCFSIAACRVSRSRRVRRWLLGAVAAIGPALAFVVGAHWLLDAEAYFGWFTPSAGVFPGLVAPVVNGNHLAGLSNLSACVGLGLTLQARTLRQRSIYLVGVLLSAMLVLATGSRAGTFCLVLGCLGVLAVAVRTHPQALLSPAVGRLSSIACISIVSICVAVLLVATVGRSALHELTETTGAEYATGGGRFSIWAAGLVLALRNPWLGVGRGAFEYSFTAVGGGTAVTYSHLENGPLQAAVDWGIPGAALFLFAVARCIRCSWGRVRSGGNAGAFVGVFVLCLHNLIDFSLELPGVALPALAASATLLPSRAGRFCQGAVFASLCTGLAALVVVLCAVAGVSDTGATAREETRALYSEAKRAELSVAQARAIFRRHPADYASAAYLAQALYHQRDRRALAVANRALSLHPDQPRIHLMAARMLAASQNPTQSLLEYRFALRDRATMPAVLDELLRHFTRERDLLQALPQDEVLLGQLIAALEARHRYSLARAHLSDVISSRPGTSEANFHATRLALRDDDTMSALTTARRYYDLERDTRAALLLAEVQEQAQQLASAEATLRSALAAGHLLAAERADLLTACARIQRARGDLPEARESLEEARALVLGNAHREARIHRELAILEHAAGNLHRAVWEEGRAAELERM
jgi:O-antigen ligase